MECRRLDLLVDGLGSYSLRLLWRPFEVVIDRLGGGVERIGDLCLNSVETLDGIAICEHQISLGFWVSVDRRGDAGGGIVGRVGKRRRRRVDALCVWRRAQGRMEGVNRVCDEWNREHARGKDISRRCLSLNVAHRAYQRRGERVIFFARLRTGSTAL